MMYSVFVEGFVLDRLGKYRLEQEPAQNELEKGFHKTNSCAYK